MLNAIIFNACILFRFTPRIILIYIIEYDHYCLPTTNPIAILATSLIICTNTRYLCMVMMLEYATLMVIMLQYATLMVMMLQYAT